MGHTDMLSDKIKTSYFWEHDVTAHGHGKRGKLGW